MRFLILLFVLICASDLKAQKFSYIHYDEKDGLGGSTVYDMCQDKEGYMWFATESGLTRFDGTHFRNFTTKDGLVDNEVLKLFADSKGRVWIAALNNTICYYYHGKIFNNRNDGLAKKMYLASNPVKFLELPDQTILMASLSDFAIVLKNGSVRKYVSAQLFGKAAMPDFELTYKKELLLKALNTDTIFVYNNVLDSFLFYKRFDPKSVLLMNDPKLFVIHLDTSYQIDKIIGSKPGMISYESKGLWRTWINTNNGTWAVDTLTGSWGAHFLPGKTVSRTIVDNENNIWFSTLGDGVFKVPSQAIQTVDFSDYGVFENPQVYSIDKLGNNIICGLGNSKAAVISDDKAIRIQDYQNVSKLLACQRPNNRVYAVKKLSTGETILGLDAYLVKTNNNKLLLKLLYPIKSIAEIDSESFLVGTSSGAIKVRTKDLDLTDTIWQKGRCTKVFYYGGDYYVGTPNGLYTVQKDRSTNFLGDSIYAFSRRITDITASADGTIWVATGDAGIVGYKNKKIAAAINSTNGLVSDICKCIFLQDHFLWVGTNKGISKVDLDKPGYPIINYSTSDGLASNVINAIYVEDSTVYVGSPEGVTYFNEKAVRSISSCDLKIQSITVSGVDQPLQEQYGLKYSDNNIRIDYVAISFKSSGDIVYHYKLEGLDNDWHDTKQTSVSYPSLPPGNYSFHIKATNKYGVNSIDQKIDFTITTPFWQSGWFYTMLILLAVVITWGLVEKRNENLRKKIEEKNNTVKQFAELEQQALQAQMNPHFIFNCLNSIQQFIVLADIPSANKYLTAFAKLVRQTLDNSSKKILMLGEEIDYLELYLELEKMRFGKRFIYSIETDNTIDKAKDMIPAMIIQPFVENSIRHGLAFKREGKGLVKISFKKEGKILICKIRDNGIGRKQAAIQKSKSHIEYQSKGMSLTQKRIDLINKTSLVNIQLEITDLYNEDQSAAGTEVTLNIS